MATKAPKSRKTHVTRIFGTNKKKEVLQDIWADVERIDESRFTGNTRGFGRQGLKRKFRWRDDPKDTGEYLDPDLESAAPPGSRKRVTELVKVCSPDEKDLNNPVEWIPIRRIKRIRSRANSQKNNTRQAQFEKWVNDELQHARVVEKRRILHYDTNIDKDAEKACKDDPTLKAYVVKASEYTRNDGKDGTEDTKDDSQYVEHEIVTKVIHRGNGVYYGNGNEPSDVLPNGRQVKKTKYQNQYLIDDSEPAKLEKLGTNDFDPPYRLDPFQNIINVQLGGLAVEFLDKSEKDGGGIQSYLEMLDGIPDMDKGLISVWVRVPGRTAAKLNTAPADPTKRIQGIPIMTFGKSYESYTVATRTGSSYTVKEYHYSFLYNDGACDIVDVGSDDKSIYNGSKYEKDNDTPVKLGNSFIGFRPGDTDNVKLAIRLQTDTFGTGKNLFFKGSYKVNDYQGFSTGGVFTEPFPSTVTHYCYPQDAWDSGFGCITGVVKPGMENKIHQNIVDDSNSTLWKEKDGPDYFEPTLNIPITVNEWHHFIISFDLTKASKGTGSLTTITAPSGCVNPNTSTSVTNAVKTITNPCKLYISIDDENIKGAGKLNADYPQFASSFGDNGIASKQVINAAGAQNTSNPGPYRHWFLTNHLRIETADSVGMPEYTYKPGKIRARGQKLGIPVFEALANEFFDIEMAELQVFKDVVGITSELNVRRAFITEEGKPNRDYRDAEAMFGKPVLRLHGSGNWKKGRNTGTGDDLTKNASGEIIVYKPNPNLHGDQGDPQ